MIDAVLALSCSVCYAPADPVVRESVNHGILVLLGVTTVVLVGVARFISSIVRRSRQATFVDSDTVVNR
jgi:hypothetical protein